MKTIINNNNVLRLFIVSFLTILAIQACKEKCGCDADPFNEISNIEAKYYYGMKLVIYESENYEVCNEDIIPNEIQILSEVAMSEGLNVVVSGKLHEGCRGKLQHWVDPNAITLTEIKLSEK